MRFLAWRAIPEESSESLNKALLILEDNFQNRNSPAFQKNGVALLNIKHTVQYALLLYYYAHQLYVDGDENSAATVYYLNRRCDELFFISDKEIPEEKYFRLER